MAHSNKRITLDDARKAGFVIDYPAVYAGEGHPLYKGLFDPIATGKLFAFDHFEPSPRTPLAGFLVKKSDAVRVPCFLKGYNRADALADAERSKVATR